LSTSVVSGRFWCVAILTATGAIGTTSRADAALYGWQDSEPDFTFPHRPRVRIGKKYGLHSGKKAAAEKEPPPSLRDRWSSRSRSAGNRSKSTTPNGFFAEAPVSTGMPGHSTTHGRVQRHPEAQAAHSNIYSNAPMPFMQRITWSGVALHAGVLPGYPASHGLHPHADMASP